MFDPDDAPPPSAKHLALAFAATVILSLGATDPTVGSSNGPAPTAVAVVGGRADFDLGFAGPNSSTLVVVSSLSRDPGPFPIRLRATAARNGPRPTLSAVDPSASAQAIDSSRPIPRTGPEAGRPALTRDFHLLGRDGDVASASNYLLVPARLAAVGSRVQVYVDERDLAATDPALVREVVSTFDSSIYPLAAARFGAALDADGDGRFTVLVSGWLSRLAGGRIKVDGFVRGADFDTGLVAPFSNHCDMMYLNAALRPGPHLRTVLAHEYTHAVIHSRRAFPSGPLGRIGVEEEGWLDEGLAHLVEDLHGFSRSNLDYRVSAFLSRPEAYRLVVDDYYAADLFRSHGNRGGTYLFLRWCVDRHGEDVLERLIRSDRRGVANIEGATGRSFPALFREWTVALFLSGLDPDGDLGMGTFYRTIDPRGMLDDWVLAGPRASRVRAGGDDDSWTAAGTSTHFAVIEGGDAGTVRIEVDGPAGAEIQVTAVPLPDGLGGIDLDVRPTAPRGGEVSVVARIAVRSRTPVRLGALAWEPIVPATDVHAPGFRRSGLDMLGIARRFGTSALPGRGHLASRPIALNGVQPGDGPVIFKAVGTDAAGRRVAAWAEVEVPAPDDNDPPG